MLAVLWLLAVSGVLRGQVDVVAFANVHAADKCADGRGSRGTYGRDRGPPVGA